MHSYIYTKDKYNYYIMTGLCNLNRDHNSPCKEANHYIYNSL